jgi:hypothetical protein
MKSFFLILISLLVGVGIGIGIMSIRLGGEDSEIIAKLLHKSPRGGDLHLVIELSDNQTAEYHSKKEIGRPLLQGKWYKFTYRYSFWVSGETITKAIVTESPER